MEHNEFRLHKRLTRPIKPVSIWGVAKFSIYIKSVKLEIVAKCFENILSRAA
jgi:hypothetical protein